MFLCVHGNGAATRPCSQLIATHCNHLIFSDLSNTLVCRINVYSWVPNKRVGWKNWRVGWRVNTFFLSLCLFFSVCYPTRIFSTLLVYLAPKSTYYTIAKDFKSLYYQTRKGTSEIEDVCLTTNMMMLSC